jgi:DNA-binding MarR family transcriptional regulator
VLSLEQLRDAERNYRRGERFGKTLVERGLVTPRELWSALQRQVEEIVRSLFSYRSGLVYFWDGEVQPDNVVRLELPTQRLVAEGTRFGEELARFVAALSDPRVRIEATPGRRELTSGAERLLVDALAEESPFGGLCRRVGLDEPTTARMLQLLHRAGVVRIRRAADDPERTLRVRPRDTELRSEIHEATKLLAELAAPIIAVEGSEPLRERFAAVVEGVAARHPALLGGIAVGPGAALDPEALIERALGGPPIPGAAEALGALVDYLEFELRNHPSVRDAAGILAAVSARRATMGL